MALGTRWYRPLAFWKFAAAVHTFKSAVCSAEAGSLGTWDSGLVPEEIACSAGLGDVSLLQTKVDVQRIEPTSELENIKSVWSGRIQKELAAYGNLTSASLTAAGDNLGSLLGLHVTISNGDVYYKAVPDNPKTHQRLQGKDGVWFRQYSASLLTSLKQLIKNHPRLMNVSFVYQFGAMCVTRGSLTPNISTAPLFRNSNKNGCLSTVTFPGVDWFFALNHQSFLPKHPDRFDAMPVVPWEKKRNMALFRGGAQSWDCSRFRLIALGTQRAVQGSLDAKLHRDVCSLQPKLIKEHSKRCNVKFDCKAAVGSFMDTRQQKKYKYLIDADGYGTDYRLKNMMFSGSVVFKVLSNMSEFWSDGLKPWTHFIPVNAEKLETELPTLIAWAQANDDKCKGIAQAGATWANKFLTYPMMHAYQSEVLETYSKAFVDPAPTDGMTRFCCSQLLQMDDNSDFVSALTPHCQDLGAKPCSDAVHPSLDGVTHYDVLMD